MSKACLAAAQVALARNACGGELGGKPPRRPGKPTHAAVPPITAPVMFDTPVADKILAALQIFPPDNPWNQDVSRWPAHSQLGQHHRLHRCPEALPANATWAHPCASRHQRGRQSEAQPVAARDRLGAVTHHPMTGLAPTRGQNEICRQIRPPRPAALPQVTPCRTPHSGAHEHHGRLLSGLLRGSGTL